MIKLKFNSQVCTTIEQSKKLLELGLKPETADMYITNMSNKGINYTDDYQIGSISFERVMSFWKEKGLKLKNTAWEIIPAWSLHRLIEMFHENILITKSNYIVVDNIFDFDASGNLYDNLISAFQHFFPEQYLNE